MAGSGEAAAAEHDGVHVEVATVLLHHHIGGELGDTEQRVQRLIDAHALVDAVLVVLVARVKFEPCGALDQRQSVGGVAVDLVGRREHERRPRAVPSSSLEQHHGADGVDREVGLGIASCPVVRWLRGAVDHEFDAGTVLSEHRIHRPIVTDVDGTVVEGRELLAQAVSVPGCRGLAAEEPAAQVIVDSDHAVAERMEPSHRGRADEARTASDDRYAEALPPAGGQGRESRRGWAGDEHAVRRGVADATLVGSRAGRT